MIEPLEDSSDDERIVNYIHSWAIERSKCGLDSDRYNKVNNEYIGPVTELLKKRGHGSVAKVLPLLKDNTADVRLAAAAIAYELDRPACLQVLRDLMKSPDSVGLMAWATLAVLDRGNTPTPTELWGKD